MLQQIGAYWNIGDANKLKDKRCL